MQMKLTEPAALKSHKVPASLAEKGGEFGPIISPEAIGKGDGGLRRDARMTIDRHVVRVGR